MVEMMGRLPESKMIGNACEFSFVIGISVWDPEV
jgi:hypothetical protein